MHDESSQRRKASAVDFEVRKKATSRDYPSKSVNVGNIDDTSGLSKVVDEMLRNYKATSADRRPFWCRICQYQGNNIDDLNSHRNTKLHVMAVQRERKLSFCRICKKQFTSPAQLIEHKKGKLHIEKFQLIKSRNTNKLTW